MLNNFLHFNIYFRPILFGGIAANESVPTRRSNVKQGRYQSSLFYIL